MSRMSQSQPTVRFGGTGGSRVPVNFECHTPTLGHTPPSEPPATAATPARSPALSRAPPRCAGEPSRRESAKVNSSLVRRTAWRGMRGFTRAVLLWHASSTEGAARSAPAGMDNPLPQLRSWAAGDHKTQVWRPSARGPAAMRLGCSPALLLQLLRARRGVAPPFPALESPRAFHDMPMGMAKPVRARPFGLVRSCRSAPIRPLIVCAPNPATAPNARAWHIKPLRIPLRTLERAPRLLCPSQPCATGVFLECAARARTPAAHALFFYRTSPLPLSLLRGRPCRRVPCTPLFSQPVARPPSPRGASPRPLPGWV